jgi:hypothetical protein
MVQSNYTVSTAQQLLGRLPTVRAEGNKANNQPRRRSPEPTKPLPPTPLYTVRVRASRSSGVLAVTDNVKIRTDVPAVIAEDEVLTLPATIYTPTAPKAKSKTPTLASSASKAPATETPGRSGASSPELKQRISQYYEYITPPISLSTIGIGRTDSRRERKASQTPTSSAGSEIYFSPIDASRSQIFLSSPQPSPPLGSPTDAVSTKRAVDGEGEQVELGEVLVGKVAELEIGTADAKVKEPERVEVDAGVARKVTLTLADVDRITIALAKAPLVQRRVRGSHLDDLPENMSTAVPDTAPSDQIATTTPTALPTPPPSESEASATDEVSSGGIALLNTTISGAPVSLSSTNTFKSGQCTHVSVPYGLSTTSNLRIEPAQIADAESRIFLQTLVATLDRKTHAPSEFTILAETDVTMNFAKAALTELATAQNLTLDDIEICTPIAPTYSSPADSESIDWAAFGREEEEEEEASTPTPTAHVTPPTATITNDDTVLQPLLSTFSSPTTFSAETCTMQTLTLLSELSRLATSHEAFLILELTRFDSKGELAGVKIPLLSTALKERFERMGAASAPSSAPSSSYSAAAASSTASKTSSANHGGLKGRLFREAVIAAVAPGFGDGEEFESVVVLEGGKVRVGARCVPLFDGGNVVERWVCFLGSEFGGIH